MEALRVVINIIFILVCVALTVLVLMQEGKSAGLVPSAALLRPTGAEIKDVPWKVCW